MCLFSTWHQLEWLKWGWMIYFQDGPLAGLAGKLVPTVRWGSVETVCWGSVFLHISLSMRLLGLTCDVMVASQDQVLQETDSGSCQFLKDWASSWHSLIFTIFSCSKQSQNPLCSWESNMESTLDWRNIEESVAVFNLPQWQKII